MNNKTNNINKSNIKVTINKSYSDVLKVQNLTFSYNQREDRILYIINHANPQERIDFFVTRRMLLKLLDAFDDILIKHCDNGKIFKELYSNQEELTVEKIVNKDDKKTKLDLKNNTNWEKSVNTKDLDFTKTKDPIILDSLSYSIDSNNLIKFKFISKNQILAISTMDITMYQRTLSSMMRVIPFLAWGISPNVLD